MDAPAISIRGLHKDYSHTHAVNGLHLDIHVGQIFALLSPNGAGKTTAVEILEGYRKRTSGEVPVLSHDPHPRDTAEVLESVGLTAPAGLRGGMGGVIVSWRDGGKHRERKTATPTALVQELARKLGKSAGEVPDLSIRRPTLEDRYLELVGNAGRTEE